MDQEQARHLPYDLDIEQALLGAMLIDKRLIDTAAVELDGSDFYDPLHARLFDMMVILSADVTLTPLVLHSYMKADAGMIEVGGVAYLAGIAAAAPAMPNVRDFVRVLKDCAQRRQMIQIGEALVDRSYQMPSEGPAQAVAIEATEALLAIGQQTARPVVSAYDTALESLRLAHEIAEGRDVPLVMTGIKPLDDRMGGMAGGDFIVIAGKPGMGKSALMCSVALNCALAGTPVFFWSGEMRRRQIVERMVCDLAHDGCLSDGERALWYSRVRRGKLTEKEFTRFGEVIGRLHGLPLEIIDESLSLPQIRARARAFKAKHKDKLGLVIGDYIQIIDPGEVGRSVSREQVVNGFARGLKRLALELDWPLMFGSQMNENDQHRGKDEKKPQGSDVRESKGIFNECDTMIGPWRPAYFVENRRPEKSAGPLAWDNWDGEMKQAAHVFEVLGLKNRHGARWTAELWCEIGANAIRAEQPFKVTTETQKNQADLLGGLS